MEDKSNERLDAAREKVQKKIASSKDVHGAPHPVGAAPMKGAESIRRNDGSVRYSSSVEEENGPKRRVTKMNRRRRKKNWAVIVLTLFFAAVITVCGLLIVRNVKIDRTKADTESAESAEGGYGGPESGVESAAQESAVQTTDSEAESETESVTEDGSSYVTISNDKIHDGNLILVNYRYEYVFPTEDVLLPMKPRADHFSVATLDISLRSEALDAFASLMNDLYENSGFDDVLVVSSFRGIEKQAEIYQDRLERYGSEYAAAYVADPGYSEHHTGLAMDLSVYTGGASYDIETYPACAWFNENYDRYGYVLRYPEHKAGITSINYEGWHYRYVGIPHSLIMDSLDLCLEEYIDYTKNYTFNSALCYDMNMGSIKTVDAASYKKSSSEKIIYFVAASNEEATKIPLAEGEYQISGNNVDGFIITVS